MTWDIYIIFYPTAVEHNFFLAIHRAFSNIDHILDYKASLKKYKKLK
jgi:hypothetical protein